MDRLPKTVKPYLTMALALVTVKAGAEMMLDVFKENPDLKIPPNWPFPSMDEFLAEVSTCVDFYKEKASQMAMDHAVEELKRLRRH